MNYKDWLKSVPEEILNDNIWKMKVYRYALFISDVAWRDGVELSKNKMLFSLSDQLIRSAGSISANLEEGYSKKSNLDRARFFEYALGSARECRGWYFRCRHKLPNQVYKSRLTLLTEIIKLLLHIVPSERSSSASESDVSYISSGINETSNTIESAEVGLINP